MPWTITAEFAGTTDEAREWAKSNGFSYAKRLSTSPNGLPSVSLAGARVDTMPDAIAKFESAGWRREALTIKVGNKERRPT